MPSVRAYRLAFGAIWLVAAGMFISMASDFGSWEPLLGLALVTCVVAVIWWDLGA